MDELKLVKEFRKKYQLKQISSEGLSSALGQQGYTVVEFNGIDDNEDVCNLVEALDLTERLRISKCFTYRDDKYRLVFLNENLTEEERIIALAHEEGHICGGHMTIDASFGEDIIQEHSANEFAHHLLEDISRKKRRRSIIIVVVTFAIIVCLGIGLYLKNSHDEAVYTEDLYRTETGSKYHIRDCMYIKDKIDVYRLTKEEFESGKYEPCGACMPGIN